MDYLYLHGFASSPLSSKAQFLQQQFARQGKDLHVLDLNQGDFAHLTLTRQLQQAIAWMAERDRVAIIGSSFGGLTAAWLAQQSTLQPKIDRLVLLAPAFQFLAQWLSRLGEAALTHWKETGWLSVYHYGFAQQCPLAYSFVEDAQQYDETQLNAPTPTLILHGRKDEVIAIQASREYAAERPWVTLVELDSDHSLSNVQPTLWEETRTFLNLDPTARQPYETRPQT